MAGSLMSSEALNVYSLKYSLIGLNLENTSYLAIVILSKMLMSLKIIRSCRVDQKRCSNLINQINGIFEWFITKNYHLGAQSSTLSRSALCCSHLTNHGIIPSMCPVRLNVENQTFLHIYRNYTTFKRIIQMFKWQGLAFLRNYFYSCKRPIVRMFVLR